MAADFKKTCGLKKACKKDVINLCDRYFLSINLTNISKMRCFHMDIQSF
ncbi:hypothetical protein EDWATA_02584 [Edwardsiella tarda ATCC 23685]|uniref:Uncharacterized protein n=1 Tax=Edwardsiella tarda ATCC 23685 TaxID=500638 RepID=D4F750_EDWTA|nr:hypothetical protein EDWATA_02584 [Edwardsiella tarda ATCC 23685]